MHKKRPSVTSLPVAPEEDLRRRMINYTIMMVIRVVCLAMLLFTSGWIQLVFALGAIFLPYFAVVVANRTSDMRGGTVENPQTPRELTSSMVDPETPKPENDQQDMDSGKDSTL